jgi:hypothetical protein
MLRATGRKGHSWENPSKFLTDDISRFGMSLQTKRGGSV